MITGKFILPFNKLSKKDTKIAGGKGASLGEISKSGFLVPPGFVILATAFDRFLEETDIDVEWALDNGKFYIVQSRPITTL